MRSTRFLTGTISLIMLAAASLAQASTVTGTVTNKTSNKPAAGDAVALVEVQSGMKDVAHTTTDATGKYSLSLPSSSPYLIRVTHHGAPYFIAAPAEGKPGDITVYDAAAQVENIAISADVYECETSNNVLYVNERYFIHNASSPPRTQYSSKGFGILLPAEAILDSSAATRPGGMATNVQLRAADQKGHYIFDFPILPSQGEKETMLNVRYHVPYSAGKYKFTVNEPMATDNLAVLLPKTMSLSSWTGATFNQFAEDPGILTFVAKNAPAAKAIEFTVAGSGELPRESQGTNGQQTSGQDATTSGQPGGGLGTPINTPDPISKYKWWILGILVMLFAVAAALMLRKPATAHAVATAHGGAMGMPVAGVPEAVAPASRDSQLLSVLKEELFALESDKISGVVTEKEYAELKAALETVLKHALKRTS